MRFPDIRGPNMWGSTVNQYENCESYFEDFMDMLQTLCEQLFPVFKVKRRYRIGLPWLRVDLKESIEKKNETYKISLKFPTTRYIKVYEIIEKCFILC